MPTTITAGKNLFAQNLGLADHAFDPSLFATKVSGVGVWLEGYDLTRFANAPRVYLVPAGNDAMLEVNSTTFLPRYWTVVDQRIPVPHPIGDSPLGIADWRPVTDTLDGLPGDIARVFQLPRLQRGRRCRRGPHADDVRFPARRALVWQTPNGCSSSPVRLSGLMPLPA